MMNEMNVKVFSNDDFEVKVTMSDDVFWFSGKDVAEALGYSDTDKAIRTHVDSEDKRLFKPDKTAGLNLPNRGAMFINESGLYSLILSSKLPSAKRFKRWVTSEVLPTIRKFGVYTFYLPQTYNEALVALGDIAKQNIELQKQLEEAKPKADFADAITACKTSIPVGLFAKTIAKQLNIGRNRLFEKLREWNLLMTLPSEYNKPTQKAIGLGIFEMKEKQRGVDTFRVKVKVTPRGQIYIYKRLTGYVNKVQQAALELSQPERKPMKMVMPTEFQIFKKAMECEKSL